MSYFLLMKMLYGLNYLLKKNFDSGQIELILLYKLQKTSPRGVLENQYVVRLFTLSIHCSTRKGHIFLVFKGFHYMIMIQGLQHRPLVTQVPMCTTSGSHRLQHHALLPLTVRPHGTASTTTDQTQLLTNHLNIMNTSSIKHHHHPTYPLFHTHTLSTKINIR